MRHFKFYVFLLFISLLTGCTLDSERPTNVKFIDKNDAQWQQHLQQIKQISAYSAQGQLGYINSKERFSSRFDWHYQNAQSYQLKLYSTLSSTSLSIEMRPQGMLISDNKGRQRSASDANELMREVVGMEFPLDKFAQWLKGQPAENLDYQVGENHLLASFSYPLNGTRWTADYLSYQANQMPQDILLKSQAQTLKIRVDSWKY